MHDMPLFSCPECGREISTRAAACPGCGHPGARRGRWTRFVVVLAAVTAAGWLYARYAPGVGSRSSGRVDPSEVSREVPATAPALAAQPERELRALEAPLLEPSAEPARPRDEPVVESRAYDAWEVEALPELTNREELDSLLESAYPEDLRDDGVSGKVSVRLMVRPDGGVEPGTVVVERATSPVFAQAALPVVDRMRFRPAVVGGMAVSVWVTIPIEFQAEAEPAPASPPPLPLPTS
jgi:TonB family protein